MGTTYAEDHKQDMWACVFVPKSVSGRGVITLADIWYGDSLPDSARCVSWGDPQNTIHTTIMTWIPFLLVSPGNIAFTNSRPRLIARMTALTVALPSSNSLGRTVFLKQEAKPYWFSNMLQSNEWIQAPLSAFGFCHQLQIYCVACVFEARCKVFGRTKTF